MKKIIGYIGAYSCYWIGDLFCRINIFNLYQTFMIWSSDIQDWAKLDGPWTNVEDNK